MTQLMWAPAVFDSVRMNNHALRFFACPRVA